MAVEVDLEVVLVIYLISVGMIFPLRKRSSAAGDSGKAKIGIR